MPNEKTTMSQLVNSVQETVLHAVEMACDYVNDMSVEGEPFTIEEVRRNARIFFAQALDEDTEMVLPPRILQAIDEVVDNKVVFTLKK